MSEVGRYILELLRGLRDVGTEGFEGLICALMEDWTGERFFLCSSGRQSGRDLSTAGFGRNWIAVECKRYGRETQLNEREVLGEISQIARRVEGLDLWVFVSSTEIKEQLATEIREEAESRGLSVLLLDPRPTLGLLLPFVARSAEHLEEHLRRAGVTFDTSRLQTASQAIASSQGYDVCIELLQRELSELVGYDGIRRKAETWLAEHVANQEESFIAFAQKLDVRSDQGARTIPRTELHDGLDEWFGNWPDACAPAAVLGEEGAGKTWACVDWLLRRQGASIDFPLTAVVTFNLVTEPPAPGALFANALDAATRSVGPDLFSKRVHAWAARPADRPLLLLLLDGVNERPDYDWLAVLRALRAEPWKGNVAAIITSRPAFYERNLDRGPEVENCRVLRLEDYTDAELSQALKQRGRPLQQIHSSLRPLIRRPRYCDLVITHFDRLTESNDLTVERLLYEDWRDKYRRKRNITIDDQAFRQILSDAAEQAHSNQTSYREQEIDGLIPRSMAGPGLTQELMDGGFFETTTSASRPYRVSRRLLVHGLGLLLFEELVNASGAGSDLAEELLTWLEPHPDMDMKLEIVGAAVFFSALHNDGPAEVRRELLRAWLSGRNLSDAAEHAVRLYFARFPDAYLELAGEFWSTRSGNAAARTRIAEAIVTQIDSMSVRRRLAPAVERWLETVHIDGHPYWRPHDGERQDRTRERLERVLAREACVGPMTFEGIDLHVIDDDKAFELQKLALLVISAGDRRPFLNAMLKWAAASTLMDVPLAVDDKIDWVMRITDEDFPPCIQERIDALCSSGSDLAQRTAFRLLRAIGSESACAITRGFASRLYPESECRRQIRENPCEYLLQWPHTACGGCMSRPDLETLWIARHIRRYAVDPAFEITEGFRGRLGELADSIDQETMMCSRGRTSADLDFEFAEPVLAAYAPEILGNLARELIGSVEERSEAALWGLSLHAPEFILILGEDELGAVSRARQRVVADPSFQSNSEGSAARDAEMIEMKLAMVEISQQSGSDQLRTLVERPENTADLRSLRNWFRALDPEEARRVICALPSRLRKEQFRTLWFLRSNPPALDPDAREVLAELSSSPDVDVRIEVLKWASEGDDAELISALAERLGPIPPGNTRPERIERYWRDWTTTVRSAALDEARVEALDLATRYSVGTVRGWPADDVRRVSSELHSDWTSRLNTQGRAEYPAQWEDIPFRRDDLIAILNAEPRYVEEWTEMALRVVRESRYWRHFGKGFLVALSGALLEVRPVRGAELWLALRESSVLDIVGPLVASDSPEVLWLRSICVEDAFADSDLAKLARVAEIHDRRQWLRNAIECLAVSGPAWRRGRGLVLAALADFDETEFEPFGAVLDADRSWLHWRRHDIRSWHDENRWARHWFEKFLVANSNDEAWAAFRLLLQVVDHRFWRWAPIVRSAVEEAHGPTSNTRIRFLRWSEEMIHKQGEKREKERTETFIGEKITKGQIYPFIGERPELLAEVAYD